VKTLTDRAPWAAFAYRTGSDAGLPPAHGQRYTLPAGAFFELRAGRIARVSNFYNLADWLQQVGA
jgi:steroid delta-isomerase-like uncharacterized protein